MTIKRLVHVMVAAGLLGAFGTANAASITAVADRDVVLPGEQVSVEFRGFFSNDPTLGGTFDILFDPAALAVASFTQEAIFDPGFLVDGTVTDGNIVGSGFGDFGGIDADDFLIATVVFDVIGVFAETNITMQNGTGGGGPFFSSVTFLEQTIDYQGATLTGIPLPAAAWLMLGGLGALFGFGRKKA